MMKCSSKTDAYRFPNVYMEEGILHLDFGFKGRITKKGVEFALRHSAVSPRIQIPVLLFGDRIIYVDYDAARFASDHRVLKLIESLAIVTVTPLEKLLGQMFLQLHHPPYPVKLFPERSQAYNWIRQQTLAEKALVR